MADASTIEVKHQLAAIASDELAEAEHLDSVKLSCAAVRTWTGVAHAQSVAPPGGPDGPTSGGDATGAIFGDVAHCSFCRRAGRVLVYEGEQVKACGSCVLAVARFVTKAADATVRELCARAGLKVGHPPV